MSGLSRLAVVAVLAAILAPASAEGSPDTLRRALENVTQAPLDLVLAPALAGQALSQNRPHVSDSRLQRGAYVVPGYLGLLGLQVLTGVARLGSGVLQTIPGVLLFPFPGTDLPEMLDPFHRGDAWVEAANPLDAWQPGLKWVPLLTPLTLDVKFGILSPAALYRETGDAPTPEDAAPEE